jgi:DNA-binding SARP family transcriptional activator/WD40 repeat protein
VVGVRVLGPTRVEGGGALPPRDRIVLGVLVANRGVSVSADQVADALWGDAIPASGRKVVQGAVARLRRSLGSEAIETTEVGYRLSLAHEQVDAWQFVDLVERAGELAELRELDRVVYVLDLALEAWCGDPLQDLGDWPLAAGEIARLEQLRCSAEEQRLEALVGLGRCDEVIATASALNESEPLRERPWELLALALYRSGRQGEALRALSRARLILRDELGVEPRREMVELELAILNQDAGLTSPVERRPAVSERCPYKGLEAYDVADAVSFCGRDADVEACRRRLTATGVLVVTGASGSGKSSLVRAGLVPILRSGGRPVACCVPGTDPPGAVATALAVGGADAALVVDQAEEMFTVCGDAAARTRFVEAVAAHAASRPVVLVLRADHVGAAAAYPPLGRMVEDGLHLLGPMTEPQLRQAIEGPASEAGLRLEPGLVDLLVRDVVDEPGALPLLSHALAETWARREGRVLTVAGYRDAGGVRGAVAATAERLYDALSDAERSVARALFLRLVEVVDDGDPVRHRLPRDDLDDEPVQRRVVEMLLRARLVSAGEDSLEVAHEAVAQAWPRLRRWLDEDREGQRIRQHLTAAAQEWSAAGRDSAELYRGSRLQATEEWADAHPSEPNAAESAFLEASRAARDEQERSHRLTAHRLRRQVVGLSLLLVVALLAASLAVVEQHRANQHADRATEIARTAQISNLVALARSLPASRIDLALLLGLEAYRLDPTVETEGALQEALARTPPGLERVIRLDSPTVHPAIDPTGRLIALPRADGDVRVSEWPSLVEVRTFEGRDSPAEVAVFSRDGRHLVIGGGGGPVDVWDVTTGRRSGAPVSPEGEAGFGFFVGADPADTSLLATVGATSTAGQVVLWDRRDVDRPYPVGSPLRFELGNRDIPFAAVSDDGTLLAAGGIAGGTTSVWDVRTRELLHELPGAPGVFVPGTHTLTTAQGDRIVLWDARSGTQDGEPLTDAGGDDDPYILGGGPHKISDDGRLLAALDWSGTRVFDLKERRQVGPLLRLGSSNLPISFLPDGRLLTSGAEALGVWRYGTNDPPYAMTLAGHSGETDGQLIAGTHDALTTGMEDHRLVRWDLATGASRGTVLAGEAQENSTVSPDGSYIAAPTFGETATGIWDATTGERIATFDGGRGGDQVATWSPSGDRLATTAADDDSVRIWDVTDPRQPALVRHLLVEDATVPSANGSFQGFFSPDGRQLVAVDAPQYIPGETSRTSTITMFDIDTGRTLWSERRFGLVSQAAFSPDGATLVTKHGDLIVGESFVTLWRAADGTVRGELDVPAGGLGVEYLRGGHTLITAGRTDSEDQRGNVTSTASAQLWDLTTLQPIGQPLPLDAFVGLYIHRDAAGTTAIISTTDGKAVVWSVDPENWEALACAIAGRNLSTTEWQRYLSGHPYRATCTQWPDAAE